MENVFENDPFGILYDIYLKDGGKKCKIYWEPNIRCSDESKKVYGLTDIDDDNNITIFVDCNISVLDSIEILAHELSHASVGIEHSHDKIWEKKFDELYEKYTEYVKDKNK